MSSAPWASTILLKTHNLAIFSLLPTSPLPLSTSRNIRFPYLTPRFIVKPCNFSSKPLYGAASQAQPEEYEEDEEPVIGDCLVYEEGIFNDPFLENTLNFRRDDPRVSKRNDKDANVSPENLIPEGWLEIQKELNITKKERRRIARELEYGRRVEKRRQALMPLNSEEFEKFKREKLKESNPMVLDNPKKEYVRVEKRRQALIPLNSEEFEKFKREKLKELNPLVLDNPKKEYFRVDDKNEKPDDERSREGSIDRAKPRNPRLAVYGGGLEDISALFESGNYDPGAAEKSHGKRKLFSKEEKLLMNRRFPDLAVATSGKWHPLHTLAASGEYYLMISLLKHSIDINAPDKDGLTAIHKAILAKKQAVFNFLLRESANPFVRDNEGATLLHYAVLSASSQMIKILLLYNVDINLQDNNGWTPLHLAVQSHRTDIVRLLLIKGADKTLKNQDSLTALDLCLYSGRGTRTYELIRLLKRIY